MSDEIHEEVRDAQRASMSYHGSEIHLKMQDQAKAMSNVLSPIKGPYVKVEGGEKVTPEHIARLENHSVMLGQIGMLVEEFCDENATTIDGVKLMKAELYELRAEQLRREAGWE